MTVLRRRRRRRPSGGLAVGTGEVRPSAAAPRAVPIPSYTSPLPRCRPPSVAPRSPSLRSGEGGGGGRRYERANAIVPRRTLDGFGISYMLPAPSRFLGTSEKHRLNFDRRWGPSNVLCDCLTHRSQVAVNLSLLPPRVSRPRAITARRRDVTLPSLACKVPAYLSTASRRWRWRR